MQPSTAGGIDNAEFANPDNESVDSGVFVAQFGVIRSEFKDAIGDYWAEVPADKTVARTVTVITQTAEDLENVTAAQAAAALEADANTDVVEGTPNDNTEGPSTNVGGNDQTTIVLSGVDSDNTIIASSLVVVANGGRTGDETDGVPDTRALSVDVDVDTGGFTDGLKINVAEGGTATVDVATTVATTADDGQ